MSVTNNGDQISQNPVFGLKDPRLGKRISQRYLFLRTSRQPSRIFGKTSSGIVARSLLLSSLFRSRYLPGSDTGSSGTTRIFTAPYTVWGQWIQSNSPANRPVLTTGETTTLNLEGNSSKIFRVVSEQTIIEEANQRSLYPNTIPRTSVGKRTQNIATIRTQRNSNFIRNDKKNKMSVSNDHPSSTHINYSEVQPGQFVAGRSNEGSSRSKTFLKGDINSGQEEDLIAPISTQKLPLIPRAFRAIVDLIRDSYKKPRSPDHISRSNSVFGQVTSDAVAMNKAEVITKGEAALQLAEYTSLGETPILHVQLEPKESQSEAAFPLDSIQRTPSPLITRQPLFRINRNSTGDPSQGSLLYQRLNADNSEKVSMSQHARDFPESQPLYRALTLRHKVSSGENWVALRRFATDDRSDNASFLSDQTVNPMHVLFQPDYLNRKAKDTGQALGGLPLAVSNPSGGSSKSSILTRMESPQSQQITSSSVESAPQEVSEDTSVESYEEIEQRNKEIAEYVIRKLSTILEVERERKGISRWH